MVKTSSSYWFQHNWFNWPIRHSFLATFYYSFSWHITWDILSQGKAAENLFLILFCSKSGDKIIVCLQMCLKPGNILKLYQNIFLDINSNWTSAGKFPNKLLSIPPIHYFSNCWKVKSWETSLKSLQQLWQRCWVTFASVKDWKDWWGRDRLVIVSIDDMCTGWNIWVIFVI